MSPSQSGRRMRASLRFFERILSASLATANRSAPRLQAKLWRHTSSIKPKSAARPAIAPTERLINSSPEVAAAAVRAIAKTHAALKQDVSLATAVGNKLFPPSEAALIAELIRRDLPYYDTAITREFVAGMNQFARDVDILQGDVAYEQVVATELLAASRAA